MYSKCLYTPRGYGIYWLEAGGEQDMDRKEKKKRYLVSVLALRDSDNIDSDEYWKPLKIFNSYEQARDHVLGLPKDEDYDITEIAGEGL